MSFNENSLILTKIRLFVSGNLIKSGRNLKKNKENIQISVVKAEKLGKIAKNWKKRECILTKISLKLMKIRLFVHGNLKKSGQNFRKTRKKFKFQWVKLKNREKSRKTGKKREKKIFKKKKKF